MLRTNVSWIELVLRPSGAKKLWTASMVHASVMGPGESGGREKMHAQVGIKPPFICNPTRLVRVRASNNPRYWPMNQLAMNQ